MIQKIKLDQESKDALMSMAFLIGALVYFAVFGMWGFIFIAIAILFWGLSMTWNDSKHKERSDKIALILLGVFWFLPILVILLEK